MNHPKVRIGTAYLLGAQGIFFISAYLLHIFLGRFLGPIEYGLFGVTLYAATMIRTCVASGFPMAVSRYVSAEPDRAEAIYGRGVQLQLGLAFFVSLTFYILSPWLAKLLGDVSLTNLFRIASPIPIFFGLFFITVQYYNGLRRYYIQSIWLAVSYVLRAVFGIGLAVIGFRVGGAVAGLVVAAAVAASAILLIRKKGTVSESYPAGKLISFSLPLILASIAQAFLTDLDLMFVKRLVTADTAAGLYTSAKALAYAAPFTFFALSSALYPAASRAYSSGDEAGLKDYIRKANLMLAALILPAVILVWSNSGGLIQLLYGEEYAEAGPALSWLAIGFSFLAVFIIHKTIITACGFPKISSVMTVALLPLSIISQFILISHFGLKGAAMATAVTFLTGVICSSLVLILKFRAMIQPVVLLRIIIAAVVVFFADFGGSYFGVPMIPKVICALLLYLAVLRLLGGWYLRDIKEFLALMTPGRQG